MALQMLYFISRSAMRPSAYSPMSVPQRVTQGGFLLVELAISAALLSLLCAGTFWALTTMNRSATSNRALMAAEAIAQSQVDLLLSTPYTVASVPASLAVTPSPATPVDVVVFDGNADINGTMVTDVVLADPTAGIRRFTVTVTCPFRNHALRVSLSSMRAPD
jgi:type II secretory pathway pseudopilin PulG